MSDTKFKLTIPDRQNPPDNSAHWHILGAGSMGCMWGSYLAISQQPVTLMLRDSSKLETFQQEGGLQLETQGRCLPISVKAEIASESQAIVRHLLVTVKAQDTVPALKAIAHRLGKETSIILLQNGMGMTEAVQHFIPLAQLFVGTTTHGCYRKSQFHVVHAGWGQTWIGPAEPSVFESVSTSEAQALSEEKKQRILSSLRETGLQIQWEKAIEQRLWQKLGVNCGINALTALLDCQNGRLVEFPEGERLLNGICQEVEQLKHHLSIPREDPPLYEMVRRVARQTTENYSSMHQDLHRGLKTEIDAINGYLLKRAEALSLDLPINRFLVDLIHMKEKLK